MAALSQQEIDEGLQSGELKEYPNGAIRYQRGNRWGVQPGANATLPPSMKAKSAPKFNELDKATHLALAKRGGEARAQQGRERELEALELAMEAVGAAPDVVKNVLAHVGSLPPAQIQKLTASPRAIPWLVRWAQASDPDNPQGWQAHKLLLQIEDALPKPAKAGGSATVNVDKLLVNINSDGRDFMQGLSARLQGAQLQVVDSEPQEAEDE